MPSQSNTATVPTPSQTVEQAQQEIAQAAAPKRKLKSLNKNLQIKGFNKARLKDAGKEREQKIEDEEEDLTNKPKDPVDQKVLEKIWKEFALEEQEKGKLLLYNVLNEAVPKLENETEIHFVIGHYSAEVEFNNEKHLLLSFLKKKLNNYHIQLYYRIEEIKEENKLYTNRDKFEFLQKKHPVLNQLMQRFNLEVDY